MKHLDTSGFSLIEIMVALAIASIISFSIVYSNAILVKQGTNIASKRDMALIQSDIVALIQGQSSWIATINSGSPSGPSSAGLMGCLVNSAVPCTTDGTVNGPPITNQHFVLYDGAGNPYYDSTNAGNGVSLRGQTCSTFVTAGAATDDCIYRFDMTWSAKCNPPTISCINPQIEIDAPFIINPNNNFQQMLNYKLFDIQIFR